LRRKRGERGGVRERENLEGSAFLSLHPVSSLRKRRGFPNRKSDTRPLILTSKCSELIISKPLMILDCRTSRMSFRSERTCEDEGMSSDALWKEGKGRRKEKERERRERKEREEKKGGARERRGLRGSEVRESEAVREKRIYQR